MTEQSQAQINYGELGESFVASLCDESFAKDFVFRSPKYSRGKYEKELCDVLVCVGKTAILFEVKSPQMNVAQAWDADKRQRWVNKKVR